MVVRKIGLSRALLCCSITVAAVVLSACGSGGSSGAGGTDNPDPGIRSGTLVEVTSSDEFDSYLRRGIVASYTPSSQNKQALLSFTESDDVNATPASATQLDYSGTYTLEANVDESDTVKYNGDYLFVAEQNSQLCCTLLEDTFSDQSGDNFAAVAPSIRVLATHPDEPSATLVTSLELPLPAGARISGLYQYDSILVALATSFSNGDYGARWILPQYWQQATTNISLFDISDIDTATVSWSASIDGNMVSSRRIGNTLYLITRFSPDLQLQYSGAEGDQIEQNNNDRVSEIELAELLPQITHNDVTSALFSPTDCYINSSEDVTGYDIITTITAIPLNNPDQFESRCYNGEAQGVYVAQQSMYITYFDWQEGNTQIHKFSLDNNDIEYRGSGEVAGSLSYRLESDFYLSEYDGDLRVISSEWEYSDVVFFADDDTANANAATDVIDEVDHRLTILRESSTAMELEVVATLPNASHPAEIGKPNEQLYGVRFFKDRAYVVTFERIDPLYILDLSDPLDPVVAGELELPGFSDFLHPVSGNLLLGIGKDVDSTGEFSLVNGIKVELFDVSDPTAPYSLDAVSIGDRGTESQVFSNRHAFTYVELSDNNHRFTLPIDRYIIQQQPPQEGSWGVWQDTGLHLFAIDNIENPSAATLTSTGAMIVESKIEDELYYPTQWENRAVIHDEAVFYIYGDAVWSAFWDDVETMTGSF